MNGTQTKRTHSVRDSIQCERRSVTPNKHDQTPSNTIKHRWYKAPLSESSYGSSQTKILQTKVQQERKMKNKPNLTQPP